MDAQQILIKNGMTTANARWYSELAEEEVRNYLNYKPGENIDQFAITTAQIAKLMQQADKITAAVEQTTNAPDGTIKSESFSEGSVSVSKTYNSPAEQSALYTDAIEVLKANKLARYRRAHVVKDEK